MICNVCFVLSDLFVYVYRIVFCRIWFRTNKRVNYKTWSVSTSSHLVSEAWLLPNSGPRYRTITAATDGQDPTLQVDGRQHEIPHGRCQVCESMNFTEYNLRSFRSAGVHI